MAAFQYFDDIHPGYPVIDEESFRRQYADPADPPPLLLFHCVLLAVSDHTAIVCCEKRLTDLARSRLLE